MSRNNPIFLDIETGGLDPSQSSILTIAAGEQGKVHSTYIRPVGGSFLSSFSEQKILPQLQGKSLTSEKEALESLILQLQKNPAAPLVGYNIRGFDVGFLQRRARIHGLEPLFQRAVGKREIRDPVYQVKDIIAGALSEHADRGTFNSRLGNRTWDLAEADLSPLPFKQRPDEYNLLSQVKGYLKASRETAMFKGWKLEDIHKILETHGAVAPVAGAAHDAAVDLVMTDNVMKAARIGKLGEVFAKPEAALQWMDIVKSRGYHQLGPTAAQLSSGKAGNGAGRLLSQTDIDQMFPTFKSRVFSKKGMVGIGIAAAAFAAGIAFSGRDDNYNTIEGLGHGNMAQQGRLALTDFGSGWRGIIKSPAIFGGILPHGAWQASVKDLLAFRKAANKSLQTWNKTGDINYSWWNVLKKENKHNYRKEYASFLRDLRQAKKAGHENIIGIEEGFDFKAVIGLDIRTVIYHERLHQKIADSGLRQATLTGGQDLDFLKSWVAADRSVADYDPRIRSEEALVRVLEYVRSPKQFLQAKKKGPTVRDMTPTPEEQAKAIAVAERWEVGLSKRRRGKFTGKDDAYNTVEGLRHGGIAQQMRKMLTPFGSGWDGLRNLVKAGETFEKMLGKKSFKQALSQATEVRRLGKGAMGTAMEMKASFRGQEFSFVRKTGDIGTDEASVLKTFQDDFAPSLYGAGKTAEGKHYLDMEMIQGKTARQVMKETGTLPGHFRQSTTDILDKMHDYGIVHGDPHLSNIMLTPEGKTALIDFGTAGRKGTDFTTLTGKTLSVNHVDTRIVEMDRRVLEASIAKNRPTPATPPPATINPEADTAAALRSQKTAVGNKRRRQADLQRSAIAQSWSNATVAGRKSRT